MRKKDHVPSRMSSAIIGVSLQRARSATTNLIKVRIKRVNWNVRYIALWQMSLEITANTVHVRVNNELFVQNSIFDT
jgi:hypothetical protein